MFSMVLLIANAISVYTEYARYSNALVNIDRQLKLNPEDICLLSSTCKPL